MKKFIAQSEISKQILKSAKLSADLPVNTLIYGEIGVGKKLLAKEILPNTTTILAKELEKLINNNQINLEEIASYLKKFPDKKDTDYRKLLCAYDYQKYK